MRLLSIAIVLVLCKCNYGQHESSTPHFINRNKKLECGVRNKNEDGVFNLLEYRDTAQFGECLCGRIHWHGFVRFNYRSN